MWKFFKNNLIKYFMGLLLFFTVIYTAISSYVLWFILPRGIGLHGDRHCDSFGRGHYGNELFIFGSSRYEWVEIHSWVCIAFIIIILIHVILHWNWINESTIRMGKLIRHNLVANMERYVFSVVLVILFTFETISGIVIWIILPRGTFDYYNMIDGVGRTFWGLQRNVWTDLHGWIAVVSLSIIIIHVLIHWRWVKNITLIKNKYL